MSTLLDIFKQLSRMGLTKYNNITYIIINIALILKYVEILVSCSVSRTYHGSQFLLNVIKIK